MIASAGGLLMADTAPEKPTTKTAKPTSKPATAPAAATQPSPRDLELIAQMEKYYADLYTKPLEIEDNARLAHLIAVTSLSRIDAVDISDRLLIVAKRSRADVRVAQMAWEALAVRQASLTEEQRETWLRSGLLIAEADGFPGATAGPLLTALSTRALTPDDHKAATKLLIQVAEQNDAATDYGRQTLATAATAIAAWNDKEVTSAMVRQMGRSIVLARRIDLMLRNLPSAPPETGESGPSPAAAWGKWLNEVKWDSGPAIAKPGAKAFAEFTTFFGKPDRIINPRDPKWNKEIELPRLKLSEVNIAFCVDATGSMAQSNEYVTAYLEMAVSTLSVLSPNIRAGAVYYRHESIPQIMVDCCRKAAKDRNNFLARALPLTKDIPGLVRTMKAQVVDPKAGHEGGAGAYATAIASAAELLGPAKKDTARVAVIVGDTFVTKGSESAVVEIAKKAADSGIIVVFVVKDSKAAASVKAASQASSGLDAVVYSADLGKFKSTADPAAGFVETAFGKASQRVIAAILTKEYADRVPPVFKGIWRIFLAEQRGAKAKAAIR